MHHSPLLVEQPLPESGKRPHIYVKTTVGVAVATTLAPRSWPSCPILAIIIRGWRPSFSWQTLPRVAWLDQTSCHVAPDSDEYTPVEFRIIALYLPTSDSQASEISPREALRPAAFTAKVEQVALLRTHTIGNRFKGFLYRSLIPIFTQILQTSDLLLAYSRIVDLQNINGIFFLQSVLIYTHNRLLVGVDPGLRTCSCLLDTQLGQTCLGALAIPMLSISWICAQALYQLVGQSLYIVGTGPRVDLLANQCFFLNVNLRIASDTSRKVGRQSNRFVKCIRV